MLQVKHMFKYLSEWESTYWMLKTCLSTLLDQMCVLSAAGAIISKVI